MSLYALSVLSDLGSKLSKGQWLAIVVFVILAVFLFLFFVPWGRTKQKEHEKEKKAIIAERRTQLLRKPNADETELVVGAFPQFQNNSFVEVFGCGLIVVLTGIVAWMIYRETNHWIGLVAFGLPALFCVGMFFAIRTSCTLKRVVKQIQQGNYLVAKGTIIYCEPTKNSCHMSGFIGEPPSEYNTYDTFVQSTLKLFTSFAMPHEISSVAFVRNFLYVSVENTSFAIVQLPNGEILTSEYTDVFLDTSAPLYVYKAYKDSFLANKE